MRGWLRTICVAVAIAGVGVIGQRIIIADKDWCDSLPSWLRWNHLYGCDADGDGSGGGDSGAK